MERYTYFDGGKWRLKIGDTEYSEINWKATRKKDLGWGLILAGGNCGTKARYKLNNVGKTVFLTREAAEAALEERSGGENNA